MHISLHLPQILILCGIIGAIAIASIADNIVRRAAALLAPDVRENIWQREAGASLCWRVPDILGVALIVVGILKAFAGLPLPLSLSFHGMAIMAVGFIIVCLANVSRLWLSSHYYQSEAPDTSASRRALSAAVVVSLAEVALAAVVGGYVFTHLPKTVWKSAAQKVIQIRQNEQPDPSETPNQPQWLDEAEALQLLEGKDAAYLKALVKRGEIRTREENGSTVYLRADINATKEAGLPDEKEVKAEPQENKEEAQ